jgi:hypothetical protein
MSNKDYRSILDKIKKVAEAPPPPANWNPGNIASTTPPTAAPAATPAASSTNTAITKMQVALVNLAKSVIQDMNTSALQGASPTPTPEQKEAGGRTSFSDFMAQHYMRQSDVPGVEFSPDPNKAQMDQKDPTQTTRMNVVMDTMRRIGNPKGGEFAIDGKWGPRTNAALHNAYAYAYALLQMAKDFNYTSRIFSDAELEQFKKQVDVIPIGQEKEFDLTDKIQLAQNNLPYLQKIQQLFREVKEHILRKPAYRSYIEGTQPFATYKSKQVADPQLIADLNKKFTNIKVTQPAQKGMAQVVRPIAVSDLASLEALQAWQKKNMPSVPLQSIIQQVKQHLDATDFDKGAQQ